VHTTYLFFPVSIKVSLSIDTIIGYYAKSSKTEGSICEKYGPKLEYHNKRVESGLCYCAFFVVKSFTGIYYNLF